jgi:class 3 adenylate cyclase
MFLEQLRTGFRSNDALANWLRERDADSNRRAINAAAILLLIAVPIVFLPPTFSQFDQQGRRLPLALLIQPVLCVVLLLVIGGQRKVINDHPWVEWLLWFLFLNTIGASAYFHSLSSVEIHANLLVDQSPSVPTGLARSFVAWTTSAYASLAVLVTAWGLSGHPRWHAGLVISNLILAIWDEPIFAGNGNIVLWLVFMHLLAIAFHRQRFAAGKRAFEQDRTTAETADERRKFLTTLLPDEALQKIARKERVADAYSNLTIVFADMVGFTDLSRRTSPGHLVEILNEMFEAADSCCEETGLERVKTIGDCYMAVAGGIRSTDVGAAEAVRFASQYIEQLADLANKHDLPISVRAGIHTGPAIGGVIGTVRPAYDYWGDAVNRASRLESNSLPGRVLLSEATWLQVRKNVPCDAPIEVEMKGIGRVQAYFVSDDTRHSAEIVSLKVR